MPLWFELVFLLFDGGEIVAVESKAPTMSINDVHITKCVSELLLAHVLILYFNLYRVFTKQGDVFRNVYFGVKKR
jgi:hypothetical protein